MSDRDERDDDRPTYAEYRRGQLAANECPECGGWMQVGAEVCLRCDDDEEDA